MKKSDLSKPLSGRAPRVRRPRRPLIAPVLVSAALLVAVVASVWVAVVDDPDGGRSVATATIVDAEPASTGSVSASDIGTAAPQPQPMPAGDGQVAALPQMPRGTGADPALLEMSAAGPLPRVSPDGRRPREAYARRASPVDPGEPRVVIVVGGLGLSQTGTQKAIEALPEDVTLAFAPYGGSLQRWIDKARGEGHEVLLQIPLEPADYPQQNPGEHTLLVSTDRHANRQDLEWVLGRATSYAGVMNYMGARFTSEEGALLPFLGEIGERGLFYLDDGSSPASVAGRVGSAMQVPVVTGDLVLDRSRSADDVERELETLEALARRKGLAIGTASAFPDTVAAIADWARAAQARGLSIVPASAAASSP